MALRTRRQIIARALMQSHGRGRRFALCTEMRMAAVSTMAHTCGGLLFKGTRQAYLVSHHTQMMITNLF